MARQRAFRHLTTSDCLSLDNDPTSLLSLKGDWAEGSLLDTSLELSPLQASSTHLRSKPTSAHACHDQHSPLSSLDNLLGSLRADASDIRVLQHADRDAQASASAMCWLPLSMFCPCTAPSPNLRQQCLRPQRSAVEAQCLLLSCLCSCSSCYVLCAGWGGHAHKLYAS